MRPLLILVLFSMAFGGTLRNEMHAHLSDTKGHSHVSQHDHDHSEMPEPEGEPDAGSLHVHTVVAPVVMLGQSAPTPELPATVDAWQAATAAVLPASPTHSIPHRPPIA